MKKTTLLVAILSGLFLIGCSSQPTDQINDGYQTNQTNQSKESKMPQEYANKYGTFSLQIPYTFTIEKQEAPANEIEPKDLNSSYEIIHSENSGTPDIHIAGYAVVKTLKYNELLENEKSNMKTLCEQTDACGKILDPKEEVIANTTFLKFTQQFPGGTIEKPEGIRNEQFYIFSKNSKIVKIWVDETAKFDLSKIVESIKFQN